MVLRDRDTTLEFMNSLPPVVDKVMSCFALGLGFPEQFFKEVRSGLPPSPSSSVHGYFAACGCARDWHSA